MEDALDGYKNESNELTEEYMLSRMSDLEKEFLKDCSEEDRETILQRYYEIYREEYPKFMKAKAEFHAKFPEEYRGRYGELGFYEVSGIVYPIMIVDPYWTHADLGLREQMSKAADNILKKGFDKEYMAERFKRMAHVIFAFGCPEACFDKTTSFVPYEEGVKRGYDDLENGECYVGVGKKNGKTKGKGKKLKSHKAEYFEEMRNLLDKTVEERKRCLPAIQEYFESLPDMDAYEAPQSDDDGAPVIEEKPKGKKGKAPTKKRKASEAKKAEIAENEAAIAEEVELAMQDIGDEEKSDEESEASVAVEDKKKSRDDDSDDAEVESPPKKKQNKGEKAKLATKAPKEPKEKKARKPKAEKKIKESKPELTDEKQHAVDQYLRNENEIFPILRKWRKAILSSDEDDIIKCVKGFQGVANDISPQFAEFHQVNVFLKESKLIFAANKTGYTLVDECRQATKAAYTQNKEKVPTGFSIPNDSIGKKVSIGAQLKGKSQARTSEGQQTSTTTKVEDSTPPPPPKGLFRNSTSQSMLSQPDVSSSLSVSGRGESTKQTDTPIRKERKSGFSLKSLTNPEPVKKPQASTKGSSDEKTKKAIILPDWATQEYNGASPPSDEHRVVALTFLRQALTLVATQTMNVEGMAHQIEAIVYEHFSKLKEDKGDSSQESNPEAESKDFQLDGTRRLHYFRRINLIAAAFAGDYGHKGTLMAAILDGRITQLSSFLELPRSVLQDAYMGKSIDLASK